MTSRSKRTNGQVYPIFQVRLYGTPEQVAAFLAIMKSQYDIASVSKLYPNTDGITVRLYVNVRDL